MRCFAVVIKIGEIFAEFGYKLDTLDVQPDAAPSTSSNNNNNGLLVKWQLRVMNESHDILTEEEISADNATKVIKVQPSTIYLVQTRVMSAHTMDWGQWSEIIRTRTFSPVRTSLLEIGEDYVRLQWDRPQRDASRVSQEIDETAVRKEAEISQFCLRVVREVDLYEIFNQEFATGTRTYTLHTLRPGTAHIVYARYGTLIGTMTNWTEVSRFFTQNTFELSLTRRAEDTFSVKWDRQSSDVTTIGYVIPDTSVHRFELSIVGEGLDIAPLEINSSVRDHTFRDLAPGALYRVRVRCLTKDGRWGVHSKVLKVALAQRPSLHPIAVGETFMSFTWQRGIEEAQESDIEWHIRSASSEFEAEKAVFIRKGAHNKKFTIESLVSNTIYFVRVRTCLMGEWGMWSEPQRFMTAKSMSIQLLERGENFFTVTWPIQSASKDLENDSRFELVLVRVEEETGDREVVMQEEVVKDTDEGYRLQSLLPNTTYELKGRAWQRNRVEGTCMWGQYSNTLRVRTLQNVALKITSIGEDFAELAWTRALALKSANPGEELWKDLKYEVIIGCVDTGEDGVVHREIVDTHCVIDNLLPATTYTVSVRACDDREQWGSWSHARFHTLAAIRPSIHEIGETFVRVMWSRDNDVGLQELLDHEEQNEITDQPPILQGDPVAKEFTLYIFSNDYDNDNYTSEETGYPRGGNSEVSLVTSIQAHHSSFRVCDLIPDRTYTAVIRASTPTGRWGIWSQEIRFHTTAPFRVPVNTLHVGENYIYLKWNRDERPSLPIDVLIEDYTVTNQQVRFRDTDTQISKELTVPADRREEKLRGLRPATAYCVQIRACNKSGEWGQWSTPVTILTRPTIVCKSVEVAENYIVVSWERPKATNPNNHAAATGKGTISSYELRVTNKDKTHYSDFVVESPFKITGLAPNTYYCVEIKGNYNDEEWGMWSTPLWCLTMRSVQVSAYDIGEEHCIVRVQRPIDERPRVPEDDGNRSNDIDRILAFGRHRARLQLCVTTAKVAPPPHAPKTAAFVRVDNPDSINLPAECLHDKVVYLTEVSFDNQDILHAVPNLKANTIYSVVARSRIDETGDWGMWSVPTHRFITVARTEVEFTDIGESFINIRWERGAQDLAGVANTSAIARGVGNITKSKIKLRDSSQHFTFIDVDTDANTWLIQNLKPAETYGISIQLMGVSGEWGVWSLESKVRTVPPMTITAENISEDAVWLSWVRESDLAVTIGADICMNVDTSVRKYELSIRGEGGFNYTRLIEEGNNCFFRGLQPDTIYEAWLRTSNGLWSKLYFATLPTIRVTFGNIGEHFADIEWRRHLPACLNKPSANGLGITQADDKIEKFALRVELPGETPIVYELASNVGSYRLRDLKPSSEYRIWMCAQGFEGVWGLWNVETRVRTLPQLNLAVDDIGENYVSVSWVRNKWACSHPAAEAGSGSDVKTWEIHGAPTEFEVQVLDESDLVVGRLKTGYTTLRCTIGKLQLKSVYTVSVRAKDTYGEWGLWSEPRRFVTLQPVNVNILRIGENFVHLEWERRTRLRSLRGRRVGGLRPSAVREMGDDENEEAYEEEEDEFYEEEEEAVSNGEAYSDGSADADDAPSDDRSAYPSDVIRGEEDVQQWNINVFSSSVFGGQTAFGSLLLEDKYAKVITNKIIDNLNANHVYTIVIRAQNMKGEWGDWSKPIVVRTQPLIKAVVLDISETTMKVAWQRPPYLPGTESNKGGNNDVDEADIDTSDFQFSFPTEHEGHNYSVSIEPLDGETPFPQGDEHVVNGARVYETSQPALQLVSLVPGTRYRVLIKEQMLNENCNGLWDNHFGMQCEPIIVETILPIEVLPTSIGENQSLLTWRRKPRNRESDSAIVPVRSTMRTAFYQLRIARMSADGTRVHEGSMSLNLTKVFKAPDAAFLLANLSPNSIYAVCAQAQLESGVWGPWSGETTFVTQRRLTLQVDSINQDSLTVSWLRQGPDWMPKHPQLKLSPSSPAGRAGPVTTPQRALENAIAERDKKAEELAAIPPNLRHVIIGDYAVNHYEVVIDGITCVHHSSITIDSSSRSTSISGLQPNNVYSTYVRSRTTRDQWSLNSPTMLVCTLSPLQLQVGHYTECTAMIAWFRPSQSIAPHEKAILKIQTSARAEAEHRERQARFERQQLIQIKAEANESATEEELAMSALMIEQAMIDAEEASHFLDPANVHMGLAEVSGYQVRLFGEGGKPIITGNDHLLPFAVPPAAPAPSRTKGSLRNKSRMSDVNPPANNNNNNNNNNDVVSDDSEGGPCPTPEAAEAQLLLNVKINPKTAFVKINGLREGTPYYACIRSRNAYDEWGPWSTLTTMKTFGLLNLCQSRFGEHYINLYWHRPSDTTLADYESRKQSIVAYSERFKNMSVEALEQLKKELEPAEYAQMVEAIRNWRSQQRWVLDYETRLSNGEGEVLSAPDMPIVGYNLRLLNETGQKTDMYFAGDVRQHTLTGLTHNAMYVVLMCADYGNGECGTWSHPLKIMTQNTIQLNIAYVGENFIDATWKRAPNKKPNAIDASSVIIAGPSQQGVGRQYEASLRYVDPATGAQKDDRRRVQDASSFRLDGLNSDTHYHIRIREWDPKGEWGMWGTEKRCVTLAAMQTDVLEIGEDWVDIKWERLRSRMRLDYDDPTFVQRPVENLSYYLQVTEISETATSLNNDADNQLGDTSIIASVGEDDIDIGAFLKNQQQQHEGATGAAGSEGTAGVITTSKGVGSGISGGGSTGGLTGVTHVPIPPTEREPTHHEDGSLYNLMKRFNADTNEFRIPQLDPNRFYKIQVLCETTGGQLGVWSPAIVALTMCKIKVKCDLVDELLSRVSWSRDGPRDHPTLGNMIRPITALCDTRNYQLVATGLEAKNKKYALDLTFDRDVQEYRMEGLTLNGCYSVVVRATDVKGRHTLWSDDVNFVTLKQLKVHAYRMTETSVRLGWGRDKQDTSEYGITTTPLFIPRDKANQYHICVFKATDLSTPLIDTTFSGNKTRYTLRDVEPNTAYVVRGRSSNVLGEWSLWSDDRVVYTMKAIVANVVSVGESYISINWSRDLPDELPDVVRGEHRDADLDTVVEAEATGDDAALKALQMRKLFPLVDRPPSPSPVYVSARTKITKYCVRVSKPQDTSDPWTAIIDGSVNCFKIPQLRHNTIYDVCVRACYALEEEDDDDAWGLWSDRVKSGTMNLLQIAVKQVGEDYFAAEWRRNKNTFPEYGVSFGKVDEPPLCYQFRVYDYTDVAIGEEADVDTDSLLVQDRLLLGKSNVFKSLRPNRRYQLAIRHWYKPANLSLSSNTLTVVSPQQTISGSASPSFTGGNGDALGSDTGDNSIAATPTSAPNNSTSANSNNINEESQIRRHLESVGALEGEWSDAITVLTLKEMVVLVSDISESSVCIRWERDPQATSFSNRQCVRVPSNVNFYHLRLDEMTKDGSVLETGAQSLHVDQEFQAEEISFRAKDLKPDAVYRIEVRCRADKVWGLWSRRVFVITLPRLQVAVTSIGEDYATLSWERKLRYVTTADGTVAVTGNVANVERYELEMEGLDYHFELKKRFKSSRTTYKVKNLQPSHVYSVVMRSCEFSPLGTQVEEWSVWSDLVVFASLKPLQLQFGKIAEQFVHVHWGRDQQTSEEYAQYGPKCIIGSTDALSYHFCVFAMDQMPTAAIVDKQFSGEVTKFRVDNLIPNTSYIMIVRACNAEQQWGLWGEEKVVTTQRVLTTDIVSIGENYVAVRWSRNAPDDELRRLVADSRNNGSLSQRKQPMSFHLCLTSESESIDCKFSSEECTYTADEARVPMYTVRGLHSDTKYILSLQACYGGDEWGTWSTPITFLTISNISVKVANITENSAEFTWGRAQQNPSYAADPNVLVWRGTVVRYQLLLRKVEEMRAQEMRSRERVMAEVEMQHQIQQITGSAAAVVVGAEDINNNNNSLVPTTTTDGVEVPMTRPTATPRDGGSEVPHFFFEQEMDVKLVKYVQTLSRIDRLEVNTEYHFQVRALDDHNEWGYWSEAFFDTPPNPPQNLIMRKDGAQILLTWEPPSRAHNYLYCIEQAVGKDSSGEHNNTNNNSKGGNARAGGKKDGSAMDWRVVDTVVDTVCRMRAFGPINRVRCRVKCCKVNTPTYLFSRYSSVVTIHSNSGIEPINDLRLTSLSKSAAVVEWSKAEITVTSPTLEHEQQQTVGSSSSKNAASPLTPAPPPPRISYRIMLAVNAQPFINVATLRATFFELTDLSPSTNYAIQVITETETGSCQRNPTLLFTTKAEADRGVYKWAPSLPPLAELVPAPVDRTLLMLGGGAAAGAAALTTAGNSTNNNNNNNAARLPALERSNNAMITPRPPQHGGSGPTTKGFGLSTPPPRGHGNNNNNNNSGRSTTPRSSSTTALSTPATLNRRPPGTAPHGVSRSGSNANRKAAPSGGAGGGPAATLPHSVNGGFTASSSAHPMGRGVASTISNNNAAGGGAQQGVVLPPVSSHRQPSAATSSSSKAVEHFDYVGFVPSDDEK